MRNILILFALFFSVSVFSQSIKLKPNTNVDYLKQSVNKTQDSLVLDCTYVIYKVSLIGSKVSKTYYLSTKHAVLPVSCMLNGMYVVSVSTNNKMIIFNLILE